MVIAECPGGVRRRRAQAGDPGPTSGRVPPCFPFHYGELLLEETNLHDWMKLSEGDFFFFSVFLQCAFLHSVEAKPLRGTFLRFRCCRTSCLLITFLRSLTTSNAISRNKCKRKESEVPHLPRFELVCRQTLAKALLLNCSMEELAPSCKRSRLQTDW